MSNDVKLGIYFRVKPQEITVKSKQDICENVDCDNNKKVTNSKFCPKCGSKVVSQVKQKKELSSDLDAILENNTLEDVIVHPEYSPCKNFYMPNLKIKGFEDLDFSDEYVIAKPMSAKKAIELALKDETVQLVMKTMKDAFGEDAISIHYGVFSYSF